MAGFVIKTTKESFKGISLHTDVTTGSVLSSGKVGIIYPFYPFLTSGIFHLYYIDESISSLMGFWWMNFLALFYFASECSTFSKRMYVYTE